MLLFPDSGPKKDFRVTVSLKTRDRGPPFHNMGLCSRPGEDPNAWTQFGPELFPDPGNRASV